MKKFLVRSISGIVFAGLIIGSIFTGPFVFANVFLAFLILSLIEFFTFSKTKESNINACTYYASGILLYILFTLISWRLLPISYWVFGIGIIFIVMIIQVLRNSKNPIKNLGIHFFSYLYLVVPLALLNFLFYTSFELNDKVIFLLIGIFGITWINDTFAYITGSLIGRTKLIERVSPNKTWEGTIGGLLFGLLTAYLLFVIFPEMNLQQWLGFALITIVFGNLGDLFESLLKRSINIKESGWIIPGHGGVLDRIDSILFASPFVFLYIYFII